MATDPTTETLDERFASLAADPAGHEELRDHLAGMHEADIAEVLDDLDDPEVREVILGLLGVETAAEVLDLLSDTAKERILGGIPVEQLAKIVDIMPPDEAAEALDHLEESTRVRAVLQRIDTDLAEDIRELREYEPETAGRVMTTEVFAVETGLSVREVLDRARAEGEDLETVHHIFVIDKAGRLLGSVEIQDLLAAGEEARVQSLAGRAVLAIHAERDQEVAARMMEKYDLAVLPVVGDGGRLLGIITFDDILEIMDDEGEEDLFRLAGIGADDPFAESVAQRAFKRLPWLFTTLFGGGALALIIGIFQPTIREVAALVSFIPVIAGLGGNVGIQSSTITVRGLATGEIEGLRDVYRLLRNEVAVGAIIGLIVGTLLAFGTAVALGWVVPEHAAAGGVSDLFRFCALLGGAVFLGILAAAVVGTMAPLCCHHFGKDPAVAAGPFVTVSIDIVSQSIYLGTASLLLVG